ncbi:MAG: M3 family oligoendopeptidase, partial [Candidatus Poribacteria bacterium]
MADSLPHWDMSVVYPGLDSGEFDAAMADTIEEIAGLVEVFEEHSIGAASSPEVDDRVVRVFEIVVSRLNAAFTKGYALDAYIHGFITTDTTNEQAQANSSELNQHWLKVQLLDARLTAWLGSLDVDALVAQSSVAADHEFMLRRAKVEAEHLMSAEEEALATELSLTGRTAWQKLYGNFTSQLVVDLDLDGKVEEHPMSAIRNFAYSPSREVRREAYEAELDAWETAAVPVAAALNSVKGEMNTLSAKRKWASPLDQALHGNNMDRASLDAMMTAARESFPHFRRYLRAKAKAIGVDRLAWYDLFASVSADTAEWRYADAEAFILEQFGTYSPEMRNLAARAFDEKWIDAEPRKGKVDGAFCMRLRDDESRILTNFKPSFSGVRTLAHELGHAYHNQRLAIRTPLQRSTPMVLAETASTFCETIVREASLKTASEAEALAIVENSVESACQVVVDITCRFLFEQETFERRRDRELTVSELCDIMRRAQIETYGDAVDPELLHPYMWAAKPHYYGSSYYNFPYMFGLLFGLGLYAQYRQD